MSLRQKALVSWDKLSHVYLDALEQFGATDKLLAGVWDTCPFDRIPVAWAAKKANAGTPSSDVFSTLPSPKTRGPTAYSGLLFPELKSPIQMHYLGALIDDEGTVHHSGGSAHLREIADRLSPAQERSGAAFRDFYLHHSSPSLRQLLSSMPLSQQNRAAHALASMDVDFTQVFNLTAGELAKYKKDVDKAGADAVNVFQRKRNIQRPVILLGHGYGGPGGAEGPGGGPLAKEASPYRIGRERLSEFLRDNKEYLETAGHTEEAKPIDFLAIGACNTQGGCSADLIRSALGYLPKRIVHTEPGYYGGPAFSSAVRDTFVGELPQNPNDMFVWHTPGDNGSKIRHEVRGKNIT